MSKFRTVLCAAGVSLLISSLAVAQQKAVEFDAEITISVDLDYLIYVPKSTDSAKLPLLVFLHGAGERGDDLERVKVHGPPKLIAGGKEFPFIVVSPQCARRQWWYPEAVIALVDKVSAEHPVDPDRVYLTGLSMGGFGTWSTASKYPGRFAAIAPICGGGEVSEARRLKNVPVWVFHGAKDRTVPIARSEEMVEALRAAGNDARFTVYPDAGHDSWTETYSNPELYEWLLSHRLSDRHARRGELPRAAPKSVGMSAEALARIDSAVEEFVDDGTIAGAVTMIARRGRVVQAKAYGKRILGDDDAARSMGLDTIFRIYSMSKPIVSVATMLLVEEGRIELDAPVSRYIPELGGRPVYKSGPASDLVTEPAKREMTVRDLLRHTAGLTYGFFGDAPVDDLYRQVNIIDYTGDLGRMIEKLGKLPLLYQPGERWVYSVASDVIGRLIEVVSGQTLDEFLKSRIFTPLDMKDTGFYVPEEKLDRFSATYTPDPDGGLKLVDPPTAASRFGKKPSMLSGGGGLVSTARDYVRFCQMILNGGELGGVRILSAKTVAEMTRNQLPDSAFPIAIGAPREGIGFGLGFSVCVSKGRIGEFGWGGAASTHFWISPKDDLVVVALSQFRPFSDRLEQAIKPIVYEAIGE